MRLIDKKIKLKEIFLDPYNPRFTNPKNMKQDELIRTISKKRDAKDLLSSMMIDIKWVNKIVVLEKKNFTDTQLEIFDIDNCEYLVVEGNNRLTCLKSGKIEEYTEETEIPVLVATKEDDETFDEFYSQLRITQGIANVMVVKEWSIIAKAKHLHNMYSDMKTKNNGTNISPHELYKKISSELGLKLTEVRQMIVRYEFFKVINETSDEIPEDRWGYLEAFDRNVEIRKKYGMNSQNNELDIENPEHEELEEILMEIPMLIDKAVNAGINTKQFRDIMTNLTENITDSSEILSLFVEITKDDSDFNFINQLNQKSQENEEEKWKNELNYIINLLKSYPVLSSWSNTQLNSLKSINKISERLVGLINENGEN